MAAASPACEAEANELEPCRAPAGAITPKGWLLEQLQLQAEGLSGHLSMFWNDIENSIWLGPESHGDGGLHERAPYWLNGFLPLAYLLKNAGYETLYPRCAIEAKAHKHAAGGHEHEEFPAGPVKPLEQVKTYIDAVMNGVNANGWIGCGSGSEPPASCSSPV